MEAIINGIIAEKKTKCLMQWGSICSTKSLEYKEGKCLDIGAQVRSNPPEILPGIFPDRKKKWVVTVGEVNLLLNKEFI